MSQALSQTPEPNRLVIEPHMTRDDLVIWRHRGTSKRLVLCFTGIGPRDEAVPSYEFAKIASDNGRDNVLYIVDPHRTWMNGEGLIERIAEAARAYRDETHSDEIVTLGHSMGGFAAIVISDRIEVKSAVALSPQFSVHPDIVSDDRRWMYHRRHIKAHRIRTVAEHMSDKTEYHVFHGADDVESPQRDRFPIMRNLTQTILPRTAHRVPQKLQRLGHLNDVVRASFNNRLKRVRKILEPMGAHRRSLDQYPALAPHPKVAT